jgi:hypothetical protein
MNELNSNQDTTPQSTTQKRFKRKSRKKKKTAPVKPTFLTYRDAIVIDFEGFKGQPPSMVGIWEQYPDRQTPDFRVLILDPELAGLEKLKFPRAEYQPIKTFMRRISNKCIVFNKKIIAYSTHEKNKFEESGYYIQEHYVNARRKVASWFYHNKPEDRPRPLGLKPVLEYFHYPNLVDYGTHKVTDKIRRIRTQLIRHNQDPTKLSPRALQDWKDLVAYNEQDVRGLVFVMERIGQLKSK